MMIIVYVVIVVSPTGCQCAFTIRGFQWCNLTEVCHV